MPDIATAGADPETDASRYTMTEIEGMIRAQAERDAVDGDTILQAFVAEYDRLKAVVGYHEGGDIRSLGGF